MALSYRSILTTTASDVSDTIVTVLDEHAQRYQRQREEHTGIDRLILKSKVEVNAGVTVTVIPGDGLAGVLVERRHPLAVDEVELPEVPTFIPDLLRRLEALGGSLPAHRSVTQSELECWLADRRTSGVAVVVLCDSKSVITPPHLGDVLSLHLMGMAAVGLVTTGAVERMIAPFGSIPNMNDGGLLYIEHGGTETSTNYVPATVTRRQPEAAVRRLRRRALAWQARTSFESDLNQRLEGFEQTLDTSRLGADWRQEKKTIEAQLAKLEKDKDTAWLEQDETLRELDRVRARLAYVGRRLEEHEREPIIDMPNEVDEVQPTSCLDAVQYAREYLTQLNISDSSEPLRKLDEYQKSFIWASNIWAALSALQSYATFRNEDKYSGNFFDFCDDQPLAAKTFNPTSIALKESESTGQDQRTRAARTFNVPVDVNSKGSAYMEAHIKIDKTGMPAPRIHFLDDTSNSGRVYVGYVGPHLPTAG